jgi:hypothetical protein
MDSTEPPFDLYVWSGPRDVDAAAAAALVDGWLADGADPARSPFDSTTDMGWFFRELRADHPDIDAVTDAVPRETRVPVWASGSDEAPARVVAIRLPSETGPGVVESVYSLAMKYDLVIFEPRGPRVWRPLEDVTAFASATFWPRGAIRAAAAGTGGAILAAVAWLIGIPILSGVLIVVGLFLAILSAWTLVHEGRVALARRGSNRP